MREFGKWDRIIILALSFYILFLTTGYITTYDETNGIFEFWPGIILARGVATLTILIMTIGLVKGHLRK